MRLPVHQGPAAWATILGDIPTTPRLQMRTGCDIAVIGAGFAGLSAARRIKQINPTAKVIVIDAGRVAEGAAGRNSGFMIDLPHELASDNYAGAGDDKAVIALNRHAIAFGADAVTDYDINAAFFDRAGKINGAASAHADAQNVSYRHHLDTLGEPSETLDSQAMRDLTGSAHYTSGLYTPGTVMLQPAGYVRGLARGLQRDGVALYENTPATAITHKAGVWRIDTPEGHISCDRVILTTNGHLESFGFAAKRLLHVFLFASISPELDTAQLRALGGAPRWGVTPSDPMGTTVRRIDTGQGGNRIVTRTCAALRPGMVATPADMARARRTIQRKFDARFPQLAGLRAEHTWAGHLCLAQNHVSVMRELETGLFAGCVQNGLGTARGTLTGIGAAELAMGQTSMITDHFTAEPAPSRVAPRPIQTLAGNAVLRWKGWKARAD